MDQTDGILIVEDRAIVAGKIRRELERAGFPVAGVAATQVAGVELAGRLAIRAAVLDVDLRGQPVYPVADVLRRREVPFVFLTGYGQAAIPLPWRDVQLIEKPFEGAALIRALTSAIEGRAAAPVEERVTTPAIRRAWDRVRHTRDILTEQRAWAEQHGSRRTPPS